MNVFNRVLFALIGLGLVAAGVLGVASAQGWISDRTINDAIHFKGVWVHWKRIDWTTGPLWALLGAAIVVALIALVLFLREFVPTGGFGGANLVLQRTPRGRTIVRTKALRKALERQAHAVEGVERASVEDLVLAGPRTEVRYALRSQGTRSVPDTGLEVVEQAASALAAALERPPDEVVVEMEVRHDARAADHNRRVE